MLKFQKINKLSEIIENNISKLKNTGFVLHETSLMNDKSKMENGAPETYAKVTNVTPSPPSDDSGCLTSIGK